MRFVEFPDRAGATVLVNPAGILFLREADGNRTELTFAGRAEPLLVAAPLEEVARALESAEPEPPDPTLALLA
ncbi:hypothetical protein [Azospirillum rugosum]|uniref:Uncharacterized protein n=1 Tax=Azospirillum rugosum TaxID=416170 RepID=A0ABS4SGC0_9PROT|nr:hypothetical protein [Azospirillum rugosum]MBP2291609.1 hypothetical protein [Azospirillum rugosum]MDQ0524579.1 hypothetical protein [Azospirillum rugosum]